MLILTRCLGVIKIEACTVLCGRRGCVHLKNDDFAFLLKVEVWPPSRLSWLRSWKEVSEYRRRWRRLLRWTPPGDSRRTCRWWRSPGPDNSRPAWSASSPPCNCCPPRPRRTGSGQTSGSWWWRPERMIWSSIPALPWCRWSSPGWRGGSCPGSYRRGWSPRCRWTTAGSQLGAASPPYSWTVSAVIWRETETHLIWEILIFHSRVLPPVQKCVRVLQSSLAVTIMW